MNLFHRVRIFAILLIITNDVAFTNVSAANCDCDFFRKNLKELFKRLKRLEESDKKKQQEIKLL